MWLDPNFSLNIHEKLNNLRHLLMATYLVHNNERLQALGLRRIMVLVCLLGGPHLRAWDLRQTKRADMQFGRGKSRPCTPSNWRGGGGTDP